MRLFTTSVLAICAAAAAQANTITADTVIAYFEEALDPLPTNGVRDGIPNGRDGGPEYEEVDLKIGTTTTDTPITDGNGNTYLSLLTGSYVVLGFSTGFIFDGTGDDLFVDEIGSASESANIYISSDFGATFTFLDVADGANTTNRFDFTDYNFLPSDLKVNAVKVEGLSDGGSSPGFDLTFVRGLEGSVVEEPQGPNGEVPLPAGLPLVLGGMGALGLLRLRRGRGTA